MEGDLLAGRYRLEQPIGRGGMATVHRAHDTTLDRPVAVKQLLERHGADESFRDRFRAEAHAAASLNHPNIVSVYDTGEHGATPFIVMELVTGRSLQETIRAGGVTEDRALEICADVCAALQYAHDRNLIHRDVKPGNILLAEDGTVKVADFGIARAIDADTVTQTASVLGTAAYLSPEQAQGRQLDNRTDLYSLGVVLYELLSGRQPFTGDSPVTVAYQHVQELPTPLRELDAQVSSAAEAIVARALAKNPGNRYQSAEEMRADIARARTGQAVSAPAVLQREDVDRSATTATLGAGAAAGAAGAAVAGTHGPADGGRSTTATMPPAEDPGGGTGAAQILGYVLLGLLTVAAVAYGVLALTDGDDEVVSQVTVPTVLDNTEEVAETILVDAGLRMEVAARVPSDTVPEGSVVSQNPDAGTTVAEGSAVAVEVSTGAETIEVPRLDGLTEEQAREAMQEAGVLFGRVVRESSTEVDEGTVIRSDPAAGEGVAPNQPVDLIVSSGEEQVRVASVRNLVDADARRRLEEQDLVVQVFQVYSDTIDEGLVVRQDPEAGTEVAVGSTVVLEISLGPAEPSPEPSPSPAPSPDPSPSPSPDPAPDPSPSPSPDPSADPSAEPSE